jgi:hypothetical protein
LFIGFAINLFLKSDTLSYVMSFIGVFVFLGLTAYFTQKLKDMALSTQYREHYSILGALWLYITFINLFLMLLRLFGGNRR